MSVAIVLLGAGTSSRMGEGTHKLLSKFDGVPLLRRAAIAAVESHAASVTVVLGHRHAELREVLSGVDVEIVVNPDYAKGMSTSIIAGFSMESARSADGVMVMLADMPSVTSEHSNRMIDAFGKADAPSVVRAVSHGKAGNPVILPRALYDAVLRLEGDMGARRMIEASGLPIIDVEVGHAAQMDVDTPEDLAAAGGVLVETSGKSGD